MGQLTPISPDDAEEKHGITCSHSRSEKGELRFRLLKNDGTAYIRTEGSAEGGWQPSHWHSQVRETYIVQSGWMIYVEMMANGEPRPPIRYEAGECFTSPPDVVHDVYLPGGAVIHTVKHGEAATEKRLEDKRTVAFTKKLESMGEKLLRSASGSARDGTQVDNQPGSHGTYSELYRHFDRLIWQVPAWATAISAIVLTGMARLRDDSPLVHFVGLPAKWILALSSVIFGLLLLVLSHALYRFRWHQIRNKSYEPEHPLRSPQVWLQAAVNVQAFVLVFMGSLPFGFPTTAYVACLAALAFALFTCSRERILLREGRKGDRPLSRRS